MADPTDPYTPPNYLGQGGLGGGALGPLIPNLHQQQVGGIVQDILNKGLGTSYPGYAPTPDNLFSGGGGGASGSFSDWLASLPTPQQLAPFTAGQQRAGLGPSLIPALWQSFAPQGEALINRSFIDQQRSLTDGSGSARREFERSLLNNYQSAGVDSLFGRNQLAEGRQGFAQDLSSARGGLQAQHSARLLDFRSGITNALAQAYDSERQLGANLYLGERGVASAERAADSASNSALFGGVLGLGASLLGL